MTKAIATFLPPAAAASTASAGSAGAASQTRCHAGAFPFSRLRGGKERLQTSGSLGDERLSAMREGRARSDVPTRFSFFRLREKVPKADEGALAGSPEANAFARGACPAVQP